MTGRTRSQVQAAGMSFLLRVAGVFLRDRVRSFVFQKELGVEPQLLHVDKSQMAWHLIRMPPRCLPN